MTAIDGANPSSPSLADLSRNTSAISTSSDDSTPPAPLLTPRTRPPRNFSAPRSLSPRIPAYLPADLSPPTDEPPPRMRSNSRGRHTMNSTDDFKFGTPLGEGSYSTVQKATHIATGQLYAIKILEKSHLMKNNKMHTAVAERNALIALGGSHPGIVRLHSTFQDNWRLYFVLDFAENGEMKTLLSRLGSLSLQCSHYYAAQLVDTIAYMHSKGVIHRDLKPENILLDANNRIKICDFGTGKVLETGVDRAQTWVGTAQYIAPELLEAKETSRGSDFWALGCIIYQFIAGRFAFQGLSDFLTWQKIKKLEYTFPEEFDDAAKDLIQKLLVREPTERLGVGSPGTNNDTEALKNHPFFKSINWNTLWTDPAPPLEAGLFKKEHPLPPSTDHIWDDVEAAWDGIMAEDEITWASDAEAPSYMIQSNGHAPDVTQSREYESLGPTDVPPGFQLRRGTGSTIQNADEIRQQLAREQSAQEPPSSIEGSPPRSLPEGNQNVVVAPPTPPPPSGSPSSQTATKVTPNIQVPLESENERGRSPSLSPKQGHGPSPEIDFASILKLPLGESVIINSIVEERSIKRRASRLIPLVPQGKPKTRHLVLTSKRLLCIKQQPKPQDLSVKYELALRASEKLKEKDKEKESKGIIATVQRKGEREFVVLTTTKMFNFAVQTSDLAQLWFNKLDDALVSHGRKPPQTKAGLSAS